MGIIIGLGVALGDHAGSFIKRAIGIDEGKPWLPWDWISYVGGAFVVVTIYGEWIGIGRWAAITLVVIVMHVPVKWTGRVSGIHRGKDWI